MKKQYLVQNGGQDVCHANSLIMAIFKEEKAMNENLTTKKYNDLFSIMEIHKDGSLEHVCLGKIIKAKIQLNKFAYLASLIEPTQKDNGWSVEDRQSLLVETFINNL